jgi:choline dehydrogenase
VKALVADMAKQAFDVKNPTGDDARYGRSGPFPIHQRSTEENTLSMRAVGLARAPAFNGA